MTVADDIETLVKRKPGLTELQISERLFGAGGYQQRISPTCRRLTKHGRIERHGKGGPAEPYIIRGEPLPVPKYPKRPRDPAQLAKLIVDIATGEVAWELHLEPLKRF